MSVPVAAAAEILPGRAFESWLVSLPARVVPAVTTSPLFAVTGHATAAVAEGEQRECGEGTTVEASARTVPLHLSSGASRAAADPGGARVGFVSTPVWSSTGTNGGGWGRCRGWYSHPLPRDANQKAAAMLKSMVVLHGWDNAVDDRGSSSLLFLVAVVVVSDASGFVRFSPVKRAAG